jgi:formate hydrogenlyase subunit 4
MIHEVMVLDHSGPDLAAILYANALKMGVFAALIIDLLVARVAQPGWAATAILVGSSARCARRASTTRLYVS